MTDRRAAPPGYEFVTWDKVNDRARIVRWIKAADTERKFPIFIHGGTGTGKTSVAALLYRRVKSPLWRRCDDWLLSERSLLSCDRELRKSL